MPLKANTLFANRYQLVRLLGRGGFSEVWLAKDSYTHLDIAIKVYAPGSGMDTDGLVEFSQELAGVFNLNHTNLLKPTHVDAWEGMPYLILPFCSQGSIVKRVGKMSEEEVWKMMHDVASGLAYLHQHDIVHQDIKPDNILVDDNGNYLITDFGISTKARSTLRKSVAAGTVNAGTMAYMGPERFSKQPTPTRASDIWSFGAMVYELITGVPPFEERGGILQKNGAEIPDINEPVSDALKQVVEQMMAMEKNDRPTAGQLVEIANTHLGALAPAEGRKTQRIEPTSAPVESKTQRTPEASNSQKKEAPKKRFKWWAIAAVLLVLVVGVTVGIVMTNKSHSSAGEHPVQLGNLIEEKVRIGNLYYDLYDNNTAKVSTYDISISEILIIPSNVSYKNINYDVICIGESVFEHSSLTSVTIPNSVTSIGDFAFAGCERLTSVTIPNSVTSMGAGVFVNCNRLTSPVYNNHVFSYMPKSYPGAYAIPQGIEKIADGAFAGCEYLTSVIIPNSVTSIGYLAFKDCENLAYVAFPNSVTDVGVGAFEDCSSLTSPIYNDYIFAYHPKSYSGAYAIPHGIEKIADGAFYEWWKLTSITIPNSVTTIGKFAFSGCIGLTSVTIPNSVTSIGDSAFFHCRDLTSIIVPHNVSIGEGAFNDCPKLKIIYK